MKRRVKKPAGTAFMSVTVYLSILLLLINVSGCASGIQIASPIGRDDFLSRAQTQERAGVAITAAVPGKAESQALFGAPLYQNGVQPVWLEITNRRENAIAFLPVGLDPQYYSSAEVANLNQKAHTQNAVPVQDQAFFGKNLRTHISPGETRSGFIFTSLDEGTKAFNIDIVNYEELLTFTFFIPVPGLRVDHYQIDWPNLYPPGQVRDLSQSELLEFLEAQTCCTTNKSGKGDGDPVNLVVIGQPDEVYSAFIRAGWDETETITSATAWKTFKSFLSGGEYRYSPVSGLYVLGRPQDVAFQKARSNIHERNHLRLWMTPVTFQNLPVWLGQISRDIGVRFTTKTITTHKIDPDVDETREFLLEDLAYSQAVAQFAYVKGAIPAPITDPRGNFTGDPYFTDGYRLVLWISSQPVDITDIRFVRWELPPRL